MKFRAFKKRGRITERSIVSAVSENYVSLKTVPLASQHLLVIRLFSLKMVSVGSFKTLLEW